MAGAQHNFCTQLLNVPGRVKSPSKKKFRQRLHIMAGVQHIFCTQLLNVPVKVRSPPEPKFRQRLHVVAGAQHSFSTQLLNMPSRVRSPYERKFVQRLDIVVAAQHSVGPLAEAARWWARNTLMSAGPERVFLQRLHAEFSTGRQRLRTRTQCRKENSTGRRYRSAAKLLRSVVPENTA